MSFVEESIDGDEVIMDLYMMLDDIDTYADACKGNYEAFFNATMQVVARRFKYYDLFEDIKRAKTPCST